MARESAKLTDEITIRLYGPDGKLKSTTKRKRKESMILRFIFGFDPIAWLLGRGDHG